MEIVYRGNVAWFSRGIRRDTVIIILGGVVIGAINFAVAQRLFGLEFSKDLQTNEGFFMGISRILAEHPSETLWWPFSDSGIPFRHTYLPLLQFVVAAFSRVAHCSVGTAFHTVAGLFFCLGPVSFFAMARVLSDRTIISLLAALAYSTISPAALASPTIRIDQSGSYLRRIYVVVFYGEVPHTAALALLPLAIMLLYLAWTRQAFGWKIGAALGMGAVATTNAFGAATLAIGVVCLLCTVGWKMRKRTWALSAAVCIAAYALVMPYLPPSVVRTLYSSAPRVGGDFTYRLESALPAAALLLGAGVLLWILRRSPPYLQFFVLWAFVISVIAYLGIEFNIYLLPQAGRYQIGMDLTLSLALPFAAASLLDRAPKAARVAVVTLVALLLAHQAIRSVRFGRKLTQSVDITETGAFKIARWLDQNRHGQRGFIGGPECYLYNVFSNNPQMGCGFEPSNPNFLNRIAMFTIYTGMNAGARDADISIIWLRAFGAQTITVPDPHGPYLNPFANPRKFEGVLPVLLKEAGETIYSVPSRSSSLAHVVPRARIVTRSPSHGLDVEPLLPYLSALDDPLLPLAEVEWENLHALRIRTELRPGQVVSVQTSFVEGWRATTASRPCPISRDGLGLMILEPDCDGACDIRVEYDGGIELRVSRIISWFAIGSAVAWWIRRVLDRREPAAFRSS